ncbi:hypothetical protein J4408_00570 [Candidatus Pacearchaeota archaeon]|nr:hypothetical protein [Candidatus Pacearchaeota archaeon]
MAVDIHKLIAAVSPDTYCDKEFIAEVKDIAKEEGYLKAAEKAKVVSSDYMEVQHLRLAKSAFSLQGLKNPIEKHRLDYDAFAQNLEPIYFFILDYIQAEYGEAERLVDNFTSTAGSGFFSEYQQRATRMQEEAMKIFQTANAVLRSVLNIVYDLKEFKLRLAQYDDYNQKDDEGKKIAALLSLKQIWLDQVDIKRGNSSIKALAVGGANQPNFITLIDAFMALRSLDDVINSPEKGGLDLNERVRRLLQQRVGEFFRWIKESDVELRKRFEIERKYLMSQVNSLRLYSQWIKPYLKAARQLEQRASPDASMASMFNTAIFELVLLGKAKYDPEGDIQSGEIPKSFRKLDLRKYHSIIIVEFKYRSAPDRSDQRGGYTYRGKVTMTFTSYGLNDDELNVLKKELAKDDMGDVYQWIEGATTESLGALQDDIDEFLDNKKWEEKKKKEEKKEESKNGDDENPFSALFSFFKKDKNKKDEGKDEKEGIDKDTDEEKVFRSQAIMEARWKCRKAYDSYKKSNSMPAFPPVL